MTPLFRKFLGLHWPLFGLMILLTAVGIVAVYSATYMREAEYLATSWRRQTMWALISLVFFFGASLIDYHWIKWGALPLYVLSLATLVAVLLFGTTVFGATRWISLGPLSFQPSQLSILAGLLMMALALSQFRRWHPLLRIALCGAISAAPVLLILRQPDLGSVLVWGPMALALLFLGRLPLRYLVALSLLAVMFIPLVVVFGLKSYQQDRILAFLNPDVDPQGIGWNINQLLIAVGSGGWEGKGFLAENTQNYLGFLPATAVHNDFIFAVIAEEHGFRGAVVMLILFAVLLLFGLQIVYCAKDDFGVLIGGGIVALFFAHIFLNVGMNVGITPITGLPLPFISYGGTFMLMTMFLMGLLQSIWVHRHDRD